MLFLYANAQCYRTYRLKVGSHVRFCFSMLKPPIEIMENLASNPINCCFCDKNLSPSGTNNDIRVVKYKCPACERLYCSATCSSGHKEKFACPGVRNKTPYVPINQFDQKQFLDDYFFLEEVNSKIEKAHKILPELNKPEASKQLSSGSERKPNCKKFKQNKRHNNRHRNYNKNKNSNQSIKSSTNLVDGQSGTATKS